MCEYTFVFTVFFLRQSQIQLNTVNTLKPEFMKIVYASHTESKCIFEVMIIMGLADVTQTVILNA